MKNDRMPVVGFVHNRKKTATRSKAAVVEILVTYGGKHKYMSTGVRVLAKEWHGGMVTGRGYSAMLVRLPTLFMRRERLETAPTSVSP